MDDEDALALLAANKVVHQTASSPVGNVTSTTTTSGFAITNPSSDSIGLAVVPKAAVGYSSSSSLRSSTLELFQGQQQIQSFVGGNNSISSSRPKEEKRFLQDQYHEEPQISKVVDDSCLQVTTKEEKMQEGDLAAICDEPVELSALTEQKDQSAPDESRSDKPLSRKKRTAAKALLGVSSSSSSSSDSNDGDSNNSKKRAVYVTRSQASSSGRETSGTTTTAVTKSLPKDTTTARSDSSVAIVSSPPANPFLEQEDRVICQIHRFQKSTGRWSSYSDLKLHSLQFEKDEATGKWYWTYHLSRGGRIKFYPNFCSPSECETVKEGILGNYPEVLRQYPIQSGLEPRLHGLVDCSQKKVEVPQATSGMADANNQSNGTIVAHSAVSSSSGDNSNIKNNYDEEEVQDTKPRRRSPRFIQKEINEGGHDESDTRNEEDNNASCNRNSPPDNINSCGSIVSEKEQISAGTNKNKNKLNNEKKNNRYKCGGKDTDNKQQQDGQVFCSYNYHGVQMKARTHVSELNGMQVLSERASAVSGISGGHNSGADVIVYRNHNDKIGYHADDTQGETSILCTVVESPMVRFLHVSPKGSNGKRINTKECQAGDEELRIFCAAGDAYEMDGEMQNHYVHALPKVDEKGRSEEEMEQYRRIAIIFRHGSEGNNRDDTGSIPASLVGTRTPSPEERYPFGPMRHLLKEGDIYLRNDLLKNFCHSSAERGISGKNGRGCSAIVVSRQSPELDEHDTLDQLWYSSTGRQGGGALFLTYMDKKNPVRVFRTTGLTGKYRAHIPILSKKDRTKQWYRYDGLYNVVACHAKDDQMCWYEPSERPMKSRLYTFKLERAEPSLDGNLLNTVELMENCEKCGTMNLNEKEEVPRLVQSESGLESGSEGSMMHVGDKPHPIPPERSTIVPTPTRYRTRYRQSLSRYDTSTAMVTPLRPRASTSWAAYHQRGSSDASRLPWTNSSRLPPPGTNAVVPVMISPERNVYPPLF